MGITMITLILIISLVSIGCTPARRPINERDSVNINQERLRGNVLNDIEVQDEEKIFDKYNLGFDNIPNNLNRDYNLRQSIRGMDSVGDAAIITHKNTAYVGLKPSDGNDESDVRKVQAEVAARVRNQEPEIERVFVTSDMKRMEEIKNLSERVTSGVPRENIVRDLERLFS